MKSKLVYVNSCNIEINFEHYPDLMLHLAVIFIWWRKLEVLKQCKFNFQNLLVFSYQRFLIILKYQWKCCYLLKVISYHI